MGLRLRDDRVLPETKWTAAVVVLVLLTASAVLYLWPNNTQQLFAWTIKPSMTSLFMGSAYFAGAYFFARVFTAARWHRVGADFPAIGVFTWFLGVATFLHWDRFNHSHVSFYAWLALYVITPILVPALWLRNRRTDPGTPDQKDAIVPAGVRRFSAVGGAIVLVLCVVGFISPDLLISVWPWTLTPLTARVLIGFFSWFGAVGLSLASDSRWSAWRVIVHSQMIGIILIVIGAIRAWGDFKQSSPLSWGFVGLMGLMLAAVAALYIVMEMRRKEVALPATSPLSDGQPAPTD